MFTPCFNLNYVVSDEWQSSEFLMRVPSPHFYQCSILRPTKAFLFSNVLSLRESPLHELIFSKLNSHTQLYMFQGICHRSLGRCISASLTISRVLSRGSLCLNLLVCPSHVSGRVWRERSYSFLNHWKVCIYLISANLLSR